MINTNIVLWVFEVIVLWLVLYFIQIPIRKHKSRLLRISVFLFKLVLIPVLALIFVAFVSGFGYRHSNLLCALYIALIADSMASLIEYIVRLIKHDILCKQKLVLVLSGIVCICLFIYGYLNVVNVKEVEKSYTIDGLNTDHKFVFVADIHAGSGQSLDLLRDFCIKVNEEKPEFVILGGDITDEYTSYEDMVMTYDILSSIEAPMYYVYGNHDKQPDGDLVGGKTYSEEQLKTIITNAGITILEDEYIKLDDELVLLGRIDLLDNNRKDYTSLINPYEGKLIVVDHEPYDEEQLLNESSILQVSGHTHAGQFWPLKYIYRLLGLSAYGDYDEPNTHLYVTSGFGVWNTPFRCQGHCEWVLINLHK